MSNTYIESSKVAPNHQQLSRIPSQPAVSIQQQHNGNGVLNKKKDSTGNVSNKVVKGREKQSPRNKNQKIGGGSNKESVPSELTPLSNGAPANSVLFTLGQYPNNSRKELEPIFQKIDKYSPTQKSTVRLTINEPECAPPQLLPLTDISSNQDHHSSHTKISTILQHNPQAAIQLQQQQTRKFFQQPNITNSTKDLMQVSAIKEAGRRESVKYAQNETENKKEQDVEDVKNDNGNIVRTMSQKTWELMMKCGVKITTSDGVYGKRDSKKKQNVQQPQLEEQIVPQKTVFQEQTPIKTSNKQAASKSTEQVKSHDASQTSRQGFNIMSQIAKNANPQMHVKMVSLPSQLQQQNDSQTIFGAIPSYGQQQITIQQAQQFLMKQQQQNIVANNIRGGAPFQNSSTNIHPSVATVLTQRSQSKGKSNPSVVNYIVNNQIRSDEINKIITQQTQKIEEMIKNRESPTVLLQKLREERYREAVQNSQIQQASQNMDNVVDNDAFFNSRFTFMQGAAAGGTPPRINLSPNIANLKAEQQLQAPLHTTLTTAVKDTLNKVQQKKKHKKQQQPLAMAKVTVRETSSAQSQEQSAHIMQAQAYTPPMQIHIQDDEQNPYINRMSLYNSLAENNQQFVRPYQPQLNTNISIDPYNNSERHFSQSLVMESNDDEVFIGGTKVDSLDWKTHTLSNPNLQTQIDQQSSSLSKSLVSYFPVSQSARKLDPRFLKNIQQQVFDPSSVGQSNQKSQNNSPSKKGVRLLPQQNSIQNLQIDQQETSPALNSFDKHNSSFDIPTNSLQQSVQQQQEHLASRERIFAYNNASSIYNGSQMKLPAMNNSSTNVAGILTSRKERNDMQSQKQALLQERSIDNDDAQFILPNLKGSIAEGFELKKQKTTLFERLQKSNQKLLDPTLQNSLQPKLPPYLAMKKMILEQQVRNSALFSTPLINLGGTSGNIEMQLKGERLSHLYQSHQQNSSSSVNVSGMAVNTSTIAAAKTHRPSLQGSMNDSQITPAKHNNLEDSLEIESQAIRFVDKKGNHHLSKSQRKSMQQHQQYLPQHRQNANGTPHFLVCERIEGVRHSMNNSIHGVVEGVEYQPGNKLPKQVAYDHIMNQHLQYLSPIIQRMKIPLNTERNGLLPNPQQLYYQQQQQLQNEQMQQQQQQQQQIEQQMKYEQTVEKQKIKLQKRMATTSPNLNLLMRQKPAGQNDKNHVDGEIKDPQKVTSRVNKAFSLINEYINLTLKNKNSMSQHQVKKLLKIVKILHVQPLLSTPNLSIFSRIEEFNRFIRTKEFLIISKGYLARAANLAITGTLLQSTIDQIKLGQQNSQLANNITSNVTASLDQQQHTQLLQQQSSASTSSSQQQIIKFYVDTTGNNNQLVKAVFRRRSWLTFSNEPLFSAFDQVHIIWTQWKKSKIISQLKSHQLYNKIEGNFLLTNKYYLLSTMQSYYERKLEQNLDDDNSSVQIQLNEEQQPPKRSIQSYLEVMPLTYRINIDMSKGSVSQNQSYQRFAQAYMETKRNEGDKIWIVKPGENSNRGKGIHIFDDINQIREFVESTARENDNKTKFVIQKYLTNPLLIEKRKFDLRVFGVAQILGTQGIREFRGYFYKEGYLRTSSREFSINDLDNRYVHLTNDAIQKKSSDYGKFETGNKMSYDDFQELLKQTRGVDFYRDILPQIKQIVADTLEAFVSCLEEQPQKTSPANCFELFGYDFMMDENLKLMLIEVNTNPCLETESCPLLSRLIPQVVDQCFKMTVDPFFDASEQEMGLAQEYPVSEIKMEMVVCRNFKVPSPQQEQQLRQEEELLALPEEEEGSPNRRHRSSNDIEEVQEHFALMPNS